MANEFRHNSVGNNLTQNEFEDNTLHRFDNQAAGDIPYASSNNTVSRLPIGSNNQVLTANNGFPVWGTPAAGGSGRLIGFQVLTNTSNATYTKNDSAVHILVEGIGGGGGGGGANSGANQSSAAGGGGGGGAFRRFIQNAANTYTYQCGAGGGGGIAGATGNNGSNTYFANGAGNLIAPGGARGAANQRANAFILSLGGNGGGVATASDSVAGDVFVPGSAGQSGYVSNRALSGGGPGGPGGLFFSGGGAPGNNTVGGTAAGYGGGGGGGSAFQNVANIAGGAGAQGVIVVWEFA
jgi:hypothetical protein